jgi:methionyl-tRNA formyltransferase
VRIITFGYQTWGHRTLSALLGGKHEVVLAVTHPPSDHPYEQMWNDSVEDLARDNGIPVVLAKKPDQALIDAVRDAVADIIVANNWRTWLPKEIYDAPRFGTLNIHDSLLPKYAGFSPLIWALINGETHVGVTAHLMDDSLDTGPIVAQQAVSVGAKDTTADLFHRTVDIIEPLVLHALDKISSGSVERVEQDLSQATYFHKRSDDESHIDFTWPADAIERLVRAQSDPYPNAFAIHEGTRLRVLQASVSNTRYGGTPGRITIDDGNGVAVVCGPDAWKGGNRALVIERVRLEDGSDVAAREYFAGTDRYLT